MQRKTQPQLREPRGKTLKEINMSGEEQKPIITIDNVEYTPDQLSDEAKMCINHINSLDQMRVGREAFMNMLKAKLPEAE